MFRSHRGECLTQNPMVGINMDDSRRAPGRRRLGRYPFQAPICLRLNDQKVAVNGEAVSSVDAKQAGAEAE